MADLSYIQSTQEVKIAGQDATGHNVNFVGADTNGNMLVKDFADGTTGSVTPATAIQIGVKNVAGNLQAPSLDRNGFLSTTINTDKSVFGPLITLSRVQQLSADFSQTVAANNLSQTVTGTGVIALSNSNATISSGTGATSSAQLQTIGSINYSPGREIYTQFTAAFTSPTSAASTQYTGLYNGTDGLLIGYNGLNFGIASVAGGSLTFVSSASFNLDTLAGAATSLFTRAGTPEAVNFTLKNVYRIRAGWLGAAPIYYEILSPDGNWVTFHIIRQPNSSVNPAFLQPSLPITMLVTKTASDSTNLVITTTSWDAGIVDVSSGVDISNNGTISVLNGAVLINTEERSTVVMDVTGTWSGTLQIQGDVGDSTWNAIYGINTNAVSAQNYTANATIIVPCAGFASIRVIATAWSSGTANVNWVATQGIQGVLAQSVGNIASGQPDIGNPIKIGGVYNSTLPVVSTGSRVDLQVDANGRLKLAGSSYFHPIFSVRVQNVSAVTTILSTSLTATISATKAGNTIIVAACCNAGTLTIADSASQTYSTATTLAGNGTQTSKIFYFPNTAAGVTTVTISSTSSTDLNLVVAEYSGVLTASPLDQTSTHGQTASTSWTSNSTPATAQASELLIGNCMGTLHNNTTFTPATGWNSISTALSTRGGANLELFMADQYVLATGTYAFTGTTSQSDDEYAAIATFKFATPNMIVPVNTAALIKSGAGILRKITVNTIGTGSASVTIYDNTTNSGTIVATLALTSAIGSVEYNLNYATGLTIVVNSTTADLTVIYD